MSIDRCFKCNDMVDTDFDLECYNDVSVCVCKNCRNEAMYDCDGCGNSTPLIQCRTVNSFCGETTQCPACLGDDVVPNAKLSHAP